MKRESAQVSLQDKPVFDEIDTLGLLKRLEWPEGMLDVIIDTDAYNEVDDQFAIAYLIQSANKLNVQAIYAAPFCNNRAATPAEGMDKSYSEIMKILSLMHREDLYSCVFRGSSDYLVNEQSPQISDAARHLAEYAMAYSAENPLYVVCISAITDVASAMLLNPAIRDRIVIVWLGGHAVHWHTNNEFNLMQDVAAARVVLGCGVAVVLLPCIGVVSAFRTTEPELRQWIRGKNRLCDYLYDNVVEDAPKHNSLSCWSRAIWDVTAVAWLINGRFMSDLLMPSPIPEYDLHWAHNPRRHPIRYVYMVNRDAVFEDLFHKLAAFQVSE